jgi:hypothetical protein
MNTALIRQKLYEYIRVADDRKVEAIYTIIENDLAENNEWWNDKNFISTLDRVSMNLKSGTDKGIVWGDLKNELLKKA